MKKVLARSSFAAVIALVLGCTITADGSIRPHQPAALQGYNDAQGNPLSASGGLGVGTGSAGVGPGAVGAGTTSTTPTTGQ